MTVVEFSEKFLKANDSVIIELGCGPYKTNDKAIGVDIFKTEGVDVIHDLNQGLSFIPDNSVDKISSRHFLEHIENLHLLIQEIHRVLKKGGVHEVIVPHHSNPFYYSDLTHKNFFGLYTFDYYGTPETMLKRKVPQFYDELKFHIVSRKLEFRSRFTLLQIFKRIFTRIVNVNSSVQEFYEETMSRRIFCSEIKYSMKK